MPELPEVETIRREIEAQILREEIANVIVRFRILRYPIPRNLASILEGKQFHEIYRRGKYLLFMTQNGGLLVHLGMSGRLQIKPQKHVYEKHEHINIIFKNGLALCYIDPRRFGAVLWVEDPSKHKLIKSLGIEPFDMSFTPDYLFGRSRKCRSAIKQFIMNSKVMVGVGNIYANEALFAAGINPLQKASKITFAQYEVLVKKIKELLLRAIKCGGTTIKDYVNSSGKLGTFQNELKIYGRANEKCVICKTKIKQLRTNGRSTFFCAHCQK